MDRTPERAEVLLERAARLRMATVGMSPIVEKVLLQMAEDLEKRAGRLEGSQTEGAGV